jgi:Short C-terminal domain
MMEFEVSSVLGHHWEAGEATVITFQEEHLFSEWPDDASSRTYVVDVRPATGAPMFRTNVRRSYKYRDAMVPERGLQVGDLVNVQCDLKHEKAKFDESDPRLYKTGQVPSKHPDHSAENAAFAAVADAAPGTPAPSSAAQNEIADVLGGGQLGDLLQQIAQDPDGFRAQAMAQGSGSSVFVLGENGLASTAATGAGQPTDVADQLTKLAALRESGVLTATEFESQKQKLLNS